MRPFFCLSISPICQSLALHLSLFGALVELRAHLFYKRKQESKKKRNKTRSRPRNRPSFLGRERIFFLFFLTVIVFFFSWSFSWSRACFLSFFLIAFLVESMFSCFLTFLFSSINSQLRKKVSISRVMAI